MIELDDKENQSPLRFAFAKSPSPKKPRSKSIGPGGLDDSDALDSQHSPDRNRRKSVTASAVKSILPSKQDEAKRREARRKSLANRRVSFAPEATLHTWDVIEYMRDATTSSTSSQRRPSSTYQGPDSDPPSTPPEQADDDSDLPESPEHQRDAHQQKRRRSSAIPPMNFNDLDDYSSSPVSGSSDAAASSEVEEEVESDDDDGESTAMSLDQGDNTLLSQDSGDSTGSSARLDAALRQASEQAGTRGIDFDEYGDMSMEMAGDEITNAFKPWSQGQHFAAEDQENNNPFDSVFRPGPQPEDDDEQDDDMSMDMTRAVGRILPQQQLHEEQQDEQDEGDMTMDMTRPMGAIWNVDQPREQEQEKEQEQGEEADEANDMTMDMTRPVGRILQSYQQQSPERTVSFGDETMDLTQAVGKIHQWNPAAQPPRSALKRRFETFATEDAASPTVKKPVFEEPTRRTVAQVRDAKRRRSSSSRQSLGDGTMDLTMAVGSIHQGQSPVKQRRLSSRSRRSSGASSVMDEQTMDFTMAVGGIKQQQQQPTEPSIIEEDDAEENEDMSMEFTAVLGKIQQQAASDIERPTTPRKSLSPLRTEIPTTPKEQDRFKETHDLSAKKLLTPLFEKQAPGSAVKDSAGSRRSSARKSATKESAKGAAFLSPAVFASPRRSPASARKTHPSVPKSPASAQKTPSSARKTPISAAKSPAPVQKAVESAQNTPLARQSPVSVKQNGSARNTPLLHKSPLSVAQTPASVARSSTSKTSSRKSPASSRRSARIGLAAIQPQQDEHAQPTPSKSPLSAKQPDDAQLEHKSLAESTPQPEQEAHDEPMGEVNYPILPAAEPEHRPSATNTPQTLEATTTPQITETPSAPSPVHHHTAVSMAGSPMRSPAVATPKQIDLEELNPASPSLEKQLRSSPVKSAATPEQQYSEEPRSTFADSIKFLSTPRKDAGTSPLKRLRALTPKKSPAKKAMTPRKMATPKSFSPASGQKQKTPALLDFEAAKNIFAVPKTGPPAKKVHLNEFLDLAGIKFMDLTASKRRHTTAPTPSESNGADGDDQTIDLEGAVVAGACTMPMLDLFQHACRELKRYISEGKTSLKTLEAEVYDDPPPFFQAYMNASSERKAQLDGNMRDAKTNARMRSKESWYDWRSKLLDGLTDGLNRIKAGLDADAEVLGQREQELESVLPGLLEQYESLQKEAEQLEKAAAAISEEEKEELRASRDRLVEVDEQIEERKRMLASLQRDVEEQDNLAEAYEEGKAESLAAIQEAERVKESCRGFTIDEVQALKASVSQLEKQTGWAVTAASGTNITMTYRNTLQLYFNTSSFKLHSSSTAASPTNSPISLTYIAGSAQPSALTTEKRFFLQLMRAQLQCLDQNTITTKSLLDFVSKGWTTASLVAEQTRRLNLEHLVNVSILSDERLAIDVSVFLPKVETKVKVGLQLTAQLSNPEDDVLEIKEEIDVKASVVYGEAYNEKNMSDFVGKRVRGQGFEGWDDVVRELRTRLIATGRKGR